jgi:hypothetical protein
MEKQMKYLGTNFLLITSLSLLAFVATAEDNALVKNTQEARALVKTFGSDLKHVLKTAMKSEGPIKALTVCNIEAGPIADKNSSLSGWKIGRTSLKVRNESNAPDKWESTVLYAFEKRKAAGENLKTMEYSETVKSGDKTVFRYMKPIPTAGLCLSCHGNVLGAEITQKVQTLYPNDTATGFTVGDIRGAFTLTKTID